MKFFLTLLAICVFTTTSLQAAPAMLSAGTTVDFDRITATNPDLAAWDRGIITGTTTIAGQAYYKIRNKAGTPYTIPNDPRWIRVVDPAFSGPAPDGTQTGPYPGPAAGQPAAAPVAAPQPGKGAGKTGVSGGAGPFPAGTKVEFDRVESANPNNGRWDTGTVVGRDPWGRVQIRGVNGILYSIHDDPRWILPAGTAHRGPRHDYLDHPPSSTNGSKTTTTPVAGGSAGPLTGEWAVIGVDGKPASGYGMTFNFVGSRYELIHYSGETEAGHFTISGSTIRMVQEDGPVYGTFQYSIHGNRLVLKAPGTEFVCERAHK